MLGKPKCWKTIREIWTNPCVGIRRRQQKIGSFCWSNNILQTNIHTLSDSLHETWLYSYDERYIECIAICWNATKMQNTSKLARLGDHKFGFPSRYAQHSKIVSIYLWENIVGGKLARWSEEETIVTLRWRWVQNNVSYPKLGIASLPFPIFFSPNNIG